MAVATSTRYKSLNDYFNLLNGLGLAPVITDSNGAKHYSENLVFASAVSQAESGGNAAVISKPNTNGTVDIGLWQINSSHIGQTIGGIYIPDQAFLLDPANNAKVAYAMSGGFTDWHAWCTAYSDAACGTKGGTYLGTGSPALKIFNSWGGGALGGLSPTGGSSATPAAGTGGVAPSTCVISLGTFGCLLGSDQARTLGGGAVMVGGAIVMLAGVVLLFKGSATSALSKLGPVGAVAGGVARGANSRIARSRKNEPKKPAPLSDQDIYDLHGEMASKDPDRPRKIPTTSVEGPGASRPAPRGLKGDEDYVA